MLNLIKLSVGSASFLSLDKWQEKNSYLHKSGKKAFIHGTTMRPKREAELLEGGSIFWVVKGFIIGRNPLVAIESHENGVGRGRCSIVCGMPMIPVLPRRHRGFQGWRYFKSEDAPKDMTRLEMKKGNVSPELLSELSDLGLL